MYRCSSRLRPTALVFLAVFVPALEGWAAETVRRVPEQYPNIQAAVDAAQPGDQVRVARGSWCGATVTKRVKLVGRDGARIVGCVAPVLSTDLRIGFLLPDGQASGTTIRNFTFDGRGVSNTRLTPLAFGIFARQADNVTVADNRVLGTVQAITNTGGSGWHVAGNVVEGLTAFTCDGRCGGGDAIVFQQRDVTLPRASNNVAVRNDIRGSIPDGLDEFSMVGILVLGQEGAVVLANRLAIPANRRAEGDGQGIVVTDHCCGLDTPFATSIHSTIVANDGRRSEFAVVIERDFSGGNGNSEGNFLFANQGRVVIEAGAALAAQRVPLAAAGERRPY
jgi:hypothetical protein